jgi:hypothetical protein
MTTSSNFNFPLAETKYSFNFCLRGTFIRIVVFYSLLYDFMSSMVTFLFLDVTIFACYHFMASVLNVFSHLLSCCFYQFFSSILPPSHPLYIFLKTRLTPNFVQNVGVCWLFSDLSGRWPWIPSGWLNSRTWTSGRPGCRETRTWAAPCPRNIWTPSSCYIRCTVLINRA